MSDLGERIIARTFVAEKTTFANGEAANNKLKSERLKDHPELFKEVIRELAQLALNFDPDLITYVPNGAEMFASPVAERLDLPIAHLFKEPDGPSPIFRSRMLVRTPQARRNIQTASRIVIIEDVSRTFSQTERVLELEGIGEKAVGEASLIHRGLPEARNNIKIPSVSIHTRYLAPWMDEQELAKFEAMAAEVEL